MRYEVDRRDGVAFVRPAGSLDAYLRTLGPRVEEAARQSASHVVLDLSEVDFIGSRGMGLLFALHRMLKALERKFIVLTVSMTAASIVACSAGADRRSFSSRHRPITCFSTRSRLYW